MNFKILNRKKLLIIISCFVVTSISGCKNSSQEYSIYEYKTENETTSETIENQNNINEIENEYSSNDNLVIDFFEKLENQIDLIEYEENAIEKSKSLFITVIDFIFYDSEINGVRFNDLTSKGKQKILQIAINIDTKIETKFPNYKETLSIKSSLALNTALKLIKNGVYNINEFSKELLSKEDYDNLINAKDDLINYSKNAIEIIENYSSDLYDSSKQKIKNWYEELKNN